MENKVKTNKNHNFLKVVSFVSGYIFMFTIALLPFGKADSNDSISRSALYETLVEFAGVGIIFFVFNYVLASKLTAIKEYSRKNFNKKIIIGIFLMCPLLVFVKANLLGNNLTNIFQVVEKTSWKSVSEDLMYFPLAAIVGPIFEEYCCRFMSICVYETTKGKVIALIITTLFFALCHGANFAWIIPSGLLFGIALLLSKNLTLPILMHIAWNTATFVVPDLSKAVAMLLPGDVVGIWDSPIVVVIAFVILFILGIVLIVKNYKKVGKI